MLKRLFAIGMLAFVLFAFLAPQEAHAQRRLNGDQALSLYDRLDGLTPAQRNEAAQAIHEILLVMRIYGTDKNPSRARNAAGWMLNQVANSNAVPAFSMFSDLKTAFDLFVRGRDRFRTDGTRWTIDLLEFAGGRALPGNYVGAIANAGREMLRLAEYHQGRTEFNAESGLRDRHPMWAKANEPRWREFSEAFYAAAWKAPARHEGPLINTVRIVDIWDYINAIETLERLGVLPRP